MIIKAPPYPSGLCVWSNLRLLRRFTPRKDVLPVFPFLYTLTIII